MRHPKLFSVLLSRLDYVVQKRVQGCAETENTEERMRYMGNSKHM